MYCSYFRLNLKYLRWQYKEHIKTAKNGGFCEQLLCENDFEVFLSTFCKYYWFRRSLQIKKIITDALCVL